MVSFKRDILELDCVQRAAEKQASRESDIARLYAGDISREELARDNSFFAALKLVNLRIAAIGGQPIEAIR